MYNKWKDSLLKVLERMVFLGVEEKEQTFARYEQIAQTLAQEIAQGKYPEGERISGRTLLAGRFKVSPETVRKAVALLQAREVVSPVAGSGIAVLSRRAARQFLEDFADYAALEVLEHRLRELIEERNRINDEIEHLVAEIVRYKEGLLKQVLYNAEEVIVSPSSPLVAKSVQAAQIRTLTGVIVTSVKRNNHFYHSPGNEFNLQAGDVLVIVGSLEGKKKLKALAAGTMVFEGKQLEKKENLAGEAPAR